MNPTSLPPAARHILITALLAPLALADSYSSAVLTDSPLAYYPLGNAAPPDVAINSGSLGAALNGSHLSVQHGSLGALVATPNTAALYNGNGRTVIPYNASLNPAASQSFTIEAWVRPSLDDLTPDGRVVISNARSTGSYQGWGFFQKEDGGAGWNFRMFNQNGSTPSVNITGGNRTPGFWTHLVAVWNAGTSTATLYVDGSVAGSQTLVGGYIPNSEAPFLIGAANADTPGANAYMGEVDEVAFYPSALSIAQIQEHTDNGFNFEPTEPYQTIVAGDGARLYLRMDEKDAWRSVAVNHGTLGSDGNGVHFPGATHQVPGALAAGGDTAMRYDRIDKQSTDGNYATALPKIPQLNTGSFSWEGWVRPTAEGSGNAQCPVMNYTPIDGPRSGWVIWQRASNAGSGTFGWNLRLYSGNAANRTIDINTGNGAGGYTVGQWQHLAVTFNETTQTAVFYVNGAAVATQTSSAGNYLPNNNAVIPALGGFANGTDNPFEGDMDEVAFYGSVLTPAQVSAHYANGTSASPAIPYQDLVASHNPVAYYRMNEAAKAVADNAGTLGAAASASLVNAPDVINGPQPPVYAGFDPLTAASLFDADDTYLEIRNPAGLNFAGAITLETWVQPAASQPNPSANIISHGGNHDFTGEVFLRIENGNYEVGANGGKASFPVPAGDQGSTAWVHLAGTWNAGQWTLYRNGTQVATGSDATGARLVNNANWAVGSRGRWKYGAGFPSNQNPGEARVFSGGITDVAIYNTALAANRINAHYLAGIGTPSNPTLTISRPGGTITLDWTGGVLQQSDDLIQWNDVPSATTPYAPADGPRHFYRLRY